MYKFIYIICLVVFFLSVSVKGKQGLSDTKTIINNSKETRKTVIREISYAKDLNNCISQFEKIVDYSYIRAGDFFRHRMNRVLYVELTNKHNNILSGTLEKSAHIPYTTLDSELGFLCPYILAKSYMYDLLSTNATMSMNSPHKLTNLPSWLNEGIALYFAMGEDRDYWPYIVSVKKDILDAGSIILAKEKDYSRYKIGQNFCAFIHETYGDGKISELILEIKNTNSIEKSLENITGTGMKKVINKFIRHAQRNALTVKKDKSRFKSLKTKNEETIFQAPLFYDPGLNQCLFIDYNLKGAALNHLDLTYGSKKKYRFNALSLYSDFSLITKKAAVSDDGKLLARIKSNGTLNNITVIDINRNKILSSKNMPFREVYDIALSKDGSVIAFIGGNCRSAEIYTYHWRENRLKRITDDRSIKRYPVFVNDGSRIIFARKLAKGTSLSYCLYGLDLNDNTQFQFYFDSGGNDLQPCISKDGKRLLFISDSSGAFKTYEYSFKKNRIIKTVSSERSFMPVYSKDGRDVVLSKFDNGTYTLWQYSRVKKNLLKQGSSR